MEARVDLGSVRRMRLAHQSGGAAAIGAMWEEAASKTSLFAGQFIGAQILIVNQAIRLNFIHYFHVPVSFLHKATASFGADSF
jgi:hypothetical protein